MLNRGSGRLLTLLTLQFFFLATAPGALSAADTVATKTIHPSEKRTNQVPVPPPPMGWSSWNSFSNTVDSSVIMQQTKALVSSGMQKAGYRYINLDEGWWLGDRDADGNIIVDPKQWPALKPGERAGDMSNIARYIHSFGLKAGIYTDAGESGCSFYSPDLGPRRPHTGSEGHYDQDFLQFAKWGFDYVKVDWCGGNKENLDPAVQYAAISHAIERAERITGHALFFSLCNWGKNSPWTWAPGVGGVTEDIWRTSGDIVNPIVANTVRSAGQASFEKVLSNFDQGIHPEAQHTGFYNDPDMMVVGMPGLSETQNRAHISLWAISGAPLMEGADLTKLNKATVEILTNPEVLAIDQDSLGLQGIKVAQPVAGLEVWTKLLAHAGEHAVLLLNRTAASAPISVTWREIGLEPSSSATVRDAWARKNLGDYRSSFTATIPAGDARMLIVRGTDAQGTQYAAGSSSNEFGEGANVPPCVSDSGGSGFAQAGLRPLTFKITPMQGNAYIRISYTNGDKSIRTAQFKMNDQIATNMAFPPTGGKEAVGTIMIEANLKPAGKNTVLTFISPCAYGLKIASVTVLPVGSH